MEACEREAGEREAVSADATGKVVQRLSGQQRQELELVYQQYARPSSALLQQLITDHPLLSHLDIHLLKAWFHGRRLKDKRDEKLSPLIHKNAELKAEHKTLLKLNTQLKNQALLLNLENRLLKEQLELQLQAKQSASSLSAPAQPDLARAESSGNVDDGESDTGESTVCGLDTSLCKGAEVKLR